MIRPKGLVMIAKKIVWVSSLCVVFHSTITQVKAMPAPQQGTQQAQESQQEQTPLSSRDFNVMTFPSYFSYHIITKVTQDHLMAFVEQARDEGIQLEFLNETEYTNLVHVLAIRTSGFIMEGTSLIQAMANRQNEFYGHQALNFYPFLRWTLENAFLLLEAKGLSPTEEKPLFYLNDITGDRQNGIQYIAFEMHTSSGEYLRINTHNMGRDLTSVLFPETQFNVLEAFPSIARHIDQGLWVSFQAFLEEQDLPRGRHITLYLKDLSFNGTIVRSWRTLQRINIGVLVEDEQGQLQDLDWLIAPDSNALRAYEYNDLEAWLEPQVTTAFHVAAHALARYALFGSVGDREFISILPILFTPLSDFLVQSVIGEFDFHVFSNERPKPKERTISEIAMALAGHIGQSMLPFNKDMPSSIIHIYNNLNNVDEVHTEMQQALTRVHQDACIYLNYNLEGCLSRVGQLAWERWLSRLSSDQRDTFIREILSWLESAETLARQVLNRHTETWIQLARLLLRKGQLEDSDLQSFYNSLEDPLALHLPLESYTNVPLNFSLSEALGTYHSLLDHEEDAFYRVSSQAFAFTRSNTTHPHWRMTRMLTEESLFHQLRKIEILDRALPWIRQQPLEGTFTTHYDQGVSPFYFQNLTRIFSSWLF